MRWISLSLASVLVTGGRSLCAEVEKPVDLREVSDKIVYAPRNEYFLSYQTHASCSVIMVVDPVTGKVTRDYLEESSGDGYLNRVALEMLRGWKFKPASPHLVRVRFDFGGSPWRAGRGPDRDAQPLNDVLAPFLGKKALKEGSLPDYPRDTPWTNKHGTGVFDLHVDAAGHVTAVTVKKSSGDAPFDDVMVRAMRQWQFRKGPLEIELPLYFALTPDKFSVRIPKYP